MHITGDINIGNLNRSTACQQRTDYMLCTCRRHSRLSTWEIYTAKNAQPVQG